MQDYPAGGEIYVIGLLVAEMEKGTALQEQSLQVQT